MNWITVALIGTYTIFLISRLFLDKDKRIKGIYFFIIGGCILILISGLRTNIGDTSVYINMYERTAERTFFETLTSNGDFGYYGYSYVLYQICANPQFMILVNAFITHVLYLKFFYRYKSFLELEIFIYIASGYYMVSMSGLRQSLAAGFVALSVKYIIDGNFKKFLLVILLTSTLHQSAIIMIPIYFISRMDNWSKKLFIFIGVSVIGVTLFYELIPVLARVLEGTNYSHYIASFTEDSGDGANIYRFLIALVPVGLAFLSRKNIDDTMFNKVFINMSVINSIFMMFALRNWIFARFSIYFNLFNYVLIACLAKNWKKDKERKLLYFSIIIFYGAFFILEHIGAENIIFMNF